MDLVCKNIKSPEENARSKVEHTYLGPMDSKLALEIIKCNAEVFSFFGYKCPG